jgi:hypothetical protein
MPDNATDSPAHTPCPKMEARVPYDASKPGEYLESDRDFVSHNASWLKWCEEHQKLIASAPALLSALQGLLEAQEAYDGLCDLLQGCRETDEHYEARCDAHVASCRALEQAQEAARAAVSAATLSK